MRDIYLATATLLAFGLVARHYISAQAWYWYTMQGKMLAQSGESEASESEPGPHAN